MPVSTVLPPGSTPDNDTFRIASLPANIGFLKRAVQPPSDVYVETSDVLVVGVATSQNNEVLTVSYRLLRFDGVVIHGQFTISPPNTRAVTIHSEQLAEGFLLSMSCKAATAVTRGQTFVRAFLTKPSLGQGQPSYMLMADYVTTAMAPAFPNGRVLAPTEGPGSPVVTQIGNPVAGNDFAITVPPNARWKLKSFAALFITAVGGGNRYPALITVRGAFGSWFGFANQFQAGGNSVQYGASCMTPGSAVSTQFSTLPLPLDLQLLGGDLFETQTLGISAGDQWQRILLAYEEWLDNV